jgi:hypothetical protein
MCLSKDSSTLYTTSQDGSLKIFSLEQKKQIRSTNLGDLALSCCAISPNEKAIIVGSWDNNMYVVLHFFINAFLAMFIRLTLEKLCLKLMHMMTLSLVCVLEMKL